MKQFWNNPLTWFAVVVAAVLLALAFPRHPHALGHLPVEVGLRLDGRPAVIAQYEDRLLVLVTFHRDQRPEAESWIDGLQLHQRSIAWVRMPVVNDPGDASLRALAEDRLMARYPGAHERTNLMPVFTDRQAFVRSAGLTDTSRSYVLVINRQGEVLARVSGAFDEGKAATVLGTLESFDL